MLTKDIVRKEFDPDKVRVGDIVSYLTREPSFFGNKTVLRHGFVTRVKREELKLIGNEYENLAQELSIFATDAERHQIRVVITDHGK